MERTWESGLEDHSPLADMNILMFGKRYELQPAADLEIHPSTLAEDLQKQPGLFAFYATCHSMAQAKVTALNQKLELQRSEMDQEIRSNGALPDGGKITEDGLRRALRATPELAAIQDKVHDAEFDAMCLGNVVRAFEHRRECLIELSKRAHNTTFNDQDVPVTVAANITAVAAPKGVGQHPSKKK